MRRAMSETCRDCLYFHGDATTERVGDDWAYIGRCLRYPKTERKHSMEWCGEWVGRDPEPWEREP